MPWIRGESPVWRDYSYSEHDFADPLSPTPWEKSLGLNQSNANCAILREDRFTLVHFASPELAPMLFDAQGKGEFENLAARPEFAPELLRLTQKLLSHRMQHMDHTLTTTVITKQGPVETARPEISG